MTAVVVGYVPGAVGEAALAAGIAEARDRGLRLVVVNSSRGDALVDDRYLQGPDAEAVRARLAALEPPGELRQSDDGRDVVEVLDSVVAEYDARLVVIGLRRRSAVGKLVLGSAATRILLGVACPVLTVRSDVARQVRPFPTA